VDMCKYIYFEFNKYTLSVYSYFKVSNGMCGWKGFKLLFLFSQHLVLMLIWKEFEVLFY